LKVNDFCTFDIKNVNIDKNIRCKLVKTPLKRILIKLFLCSARRYAILNISN